MLAVHPNDYGCIVMELSARVEDPKKWTIAKIFLPSLTPEDLKDSKKLKIKLFQTIVHLEPITIGL